MLNTIIGVGGLVDVGGLVGMPERHSEDFGQTLAVYGVGSGPYLMLPLLGPSNPRDAAGRVVDLAFDPLFFLAPASVSIARFGVQTVSFREHNIETFDESGAQQPRPLCRDPDPGPPAARQRNPQRRARADRGHLQ